MNEHEHIHPSPFIPGHWRVHFQSSPAPALWPPLLGIPLLGAAAVASGTETTQAPSSGDSGKMEGNSNVDDNDFLGTKLGAVLYQQIFDGVVHRRRRLGWSKTACASRMPPTSLPLSPSIWAGSTSARGLAV